MKLKYLLFFIIPLFFSCAKRDLVYFSDLNQDVIYNEKISNVAKEPLIQSGDLLSIFVSSPNAEASMPFNRMLPMVNAGGGTSMASGAGSAEGYLVDSDGNIDFPVLGIMAVNGLSKTALKIMLTKKLVEYLNDPVVNIRYLNYKITVIGEVNAPSTFNIPNERINLLEALGLAGDMTAFGKRNNVMVIKESGGERSIAHLDLNDSNILNSPFFYLQPNDIVYVEPVKSKKEQASLTRSNIGILLAVISAVGILLLNR